uniref:Nectin cell adhesion molecule 3 n=2 Tax=Latimeria chalumnae TaxID=7897 RepID=H3B987_LATCH
MAGRRAATASDLDWGKRSPLSLPAAFLFLLTLNFCGALTGPLIVDPNVIAILGKNVTLKCLIKMNETITQISWEKLQGGITRTIAVYNPNYGSSIQDEYQGRVHFKNESLTDATIILNDIDFSDSGEYICKAATFPLGNTQASTVVIVMAEPNVHLSKGPNLLIDGGNETVAAVCTAANGKPAAEITWEGDLGKIDQWNISSQSETITVISQYKLIPTRFARGRKIFCVVKHPTLKTAIQIPYTLDIQYPPEVSVTGYDGNWYVGRENVQLKCNADANPLPTDFRWNRWDGLWPEDLVAENNTLIFTKPLSHNHSGIYVCEVTNIHGQRSSQKAVHVLNPPTTITTPSPTTPQPHSTAGITSLAAAPEKKAHVPASTLESLRNENMGTIIGSAVGGALFLILVAVLVGVLCMRQRRTFRGDYYTKQYIGPSDMQKESQVDVLQSHELDPYLNIEKDELKHPDNMLIYQGYPLDVKKSEWSTVECMNNQYADEVEIPVNYFKDRKCSFVGNYDNYEDNEDDFVSHLDGSVISRKE